MKIEKATDEVLGLEMYHTMLSCGMTAYFVPLNREVEISMYHLCTKFGSIDAKFKNPQGEEMEVEDGTAHFLEHCAFYDPEGNDAGQWFDSNGLSSNAWTNNDHTTYYFHSLGENLKRNLDYLIGFVATPFFTDENVKREQGIIAQEIAMYADYPEESHFRALRKALFKVNPIRRSIVGDVASIMKITKEYLQGAYDTFYHPSNLNLIMFVPPSGSSMAEARKHFELAEEICTARGFEYKIPPQYVYTDELAEVNEKRVVLYHNTPEPKFAMGFKAQCEMVDNPRKRLRANLVNDLFMDTMFSKSSNDIQDILDSGIVRTDFNGSYHDGRGFGYFYMFGSTPTPDLLEERVLEFIQKQVNGGLSKELFEIQQRNAISNFANYLEMEVPTAFASLFVYPICAELPPLDYLKTWKSITYEEALEAGKRYLDTDNRSVVIMNPRKDEPKEQ